MWTQLQYQTSTNNTQFFTNNCCPGSETLLLSGLTKDLKANPVVVENLVDLWTRFAKTGDPNGGMNVTWPQYTRAEDRYLDINNVSTVLSGY